MNSDQTPESKAADQQLNACLSSAAPNEPLVEVTPDLEQRRILDYQAESLGKPDAREACLGSSNGSLMQIGCHLAEVIKEGMVGLNIANFSRVQPALESYMRVTRQIDRYLHLEVAITESRRRSEEAKLSLQPAPLRGFPQDTMRSKVSTMPARW
jgi:hypothetical protein